MALNYERMPRYARAIYRWAEIAHIRFIGK
jgi:hypothetical protein